LKRQFASAAPAAASASPIAALFKKPPPYLLNLPRLKETTLDNGFRVASESNGGETASVAIFIDAGSSYETSETNGVAHFLEHMSFKVRRDMHTHHHCCDGCFFACFYSSPERV
jgi:hypothetical protein